MEIIILIILLVTFIPVIKPFGEKKSGDLVQFILTGTYLFYLIVYLVFCYSALFRDLNLGYGLGDLFYYLIFTITIVISNLAMGMRFKASKELKYFFMAINIMGAIFLITTLFESNL